MAHIRLPIDVRSVAIARAALYETLRLHGGQPWPGARQEAVDCAALMVSELVTNAIRHSRDLLLLDVTVDGDLLHVAVVDDGPGTPVIRADDHRAAHGRGLGIVNALADRWGISPGAARKAVWFELQLPAAAPREHRP